MRESHEILQAYFESYLLTEKRVSRNTFDAYKRDIKQLTQSLEVQGFTVYNCTKTHLREYIASLKEKKLGVKSICRKVSSVKLFFSFLFKRYGIEDKAEHLVFPKLPKHFPTYLTDQEVQLLLQTAMNILSARGMRNRVMIYLLYATGMRVSELVTLKSSDLHFDTGFILCHGKGSKERMIPLPSDSITLLREYLETVYPLLIPPRTMVQEHYLFASYGGGKEKPISRQVVWMVIKDLIGKAGIKKNISPHSLRHSLATHLLKNGANLRSLQMLLGHENLTTVEIYTHLDTKELRKIYDKAHPRA